MKPPNKKQSRRGDTARFEGSSPTKRTSRRADPILLAGKIVHAGVFNSVKDVQRIQHDLVQLVRTTVSDSLIASGHVGDGAIELVSTVVDAAIGAIGPAGASPDVIARSLAKGIVLGVHEIGDDIKLAAFQTMHTLTRHSAALGGDLTRIAPDAVCGVAEAAEEIGGLDSEIVRQAAHGAISGAGEISTLAMDTVRRVLHGLLGHESADLQSSHLQDLLFRFPPAR